MIINKENATGQDKKGKTMTKKIQGKDKTRQRQRQDETKTRQDKD